MIRYKIHCVAPKIFAVIVPNHDDRSLLFCRIQEYSESPNPQFRGQTFDMQDFVKWYNHGQFTYATDWQGFNVSFRNAIKCYSDLPAHLMTVYDDIFVIILAEIAKLIGNTTDNAYIISSEGLNSITMQHEMFHALYFTDAKYRKQTVKTLKRLPKNVYKKLRSNLIHIGYFDDDYVIHNEMQAYMRGRDWNHPNVSEGIDIKTLKRIHKIVERGLEEFPTWTPKQGKNTECSSDHSIHFV